PYALEIDRKRRIPVAERVGLADPRVDRRQIAIGCRPGEWDDSGDLEVGGACLEESRFLPDVVLERQRITGPGVELTCDPLVDDDRRLAAGGRRRNTRCHYRQVGGG